MGHSERQRGTYFQAVMIALRAAVAIGLAFAIFAFAAFEISDMNRTGLWPAHIEMDTKEYVYGDRNGKVVQQHQGIWIHPARQWRSGCFRPHFRCRTSGPFDP
ncbi:hypothetical protein MES4922_380039 [Mesorhizobium ventifaucium]|uniref:Uncharacterized protein n=1 Tax=Mesorhizobium ventifaucium TaxID=666020 RepID=A0ABM9E726_9HYPH|nr:hypothetical protein MES4922_380039 [Mesorhizobium ventifaucium]